MTTNPLIAHIDYETRSRVDLSGCGAYRYAEDESTDILMAAVAGDEPNDPVYLWVHPAFRDLGNHESEQAERCLAEADLLYAHNAPFEIAITWGADRRKAPSPFAAPPDLSKWRDTAAMARKAGLPDKLATLSKALRLGDDAKDSKGKALIRWFSVPTSKGIFRDPHDHVAKWLEFCNYCRQDARAERTTRHKLKAFELTGASLDTFLFDLRMNQLGIPVNVSALHNAQRIIDEVTAKVTSQFQAITGGLMPTQRQAVKDHLLALGLDLPDMTADTFAEIDKHLDRISDPVKRERAARVAGLYIKLSYAAAKKVTTMLDCVCSDGRVRGTLLYYGAGTGRWAGRLIQPQNFKKTPKWLKKFTSYVYNDVRSGVNADYIEAVWGEPLEVIAGIIRHFIEAFRPLLDGDYSNVEARVICWLAGQHDALREYAAGLDRYVLMAAEIYGVPPDRIPKDGLERQLGKVAILGLGYGMGAKKFYDTCLAWGLEGITPELCEATKVAFRRKHQEVVRYWYTLDQNARNAVTNPGTTYGAFSVRTLAGIPYLLFRLRSGRSLAYPYPRIELCNPTEADWEQVRESFREQGHTPEDVERLTKLHPPEPREALTYWGQIPGKAIWGRIKLYGGKLAEHETQATAADLMAFGSLVAEARGMMPFTLIHDQALAERTADQSPQEFEDALGTLPPWAKGLPLAVEAKITPYYTK